MRDKRLSARRKLQIYVELALWLKESRGVCARRDIGARIYNLRRAKSTTAAGQAVTISDVGRYISLARQYLERHYELTLVSVKGGGYKVADRYETALFAMQTLKRTALYARRTQRLAGITDMRYVPAAYKKVFKRSASGLRMLERQSAGLLEAFEANREPETTT